MELYIQDIINSSELANMLTIQKLEILIMASILGLTAGISPGPLLTLVISQTLQYNRKEGVKIALSPLITDVPIILISLLIFRRFSEFEIFLGIISFLGGAFIFYFGYQTIRAKNYIPTENYFNVKSLRKGVVANFLSPHPYLFWVTIGASYIYKCLDISKSTVILFFYFICF